ncbi:MAG: ABC transporter permease subunit [Planctomycetes bacterium]|nr:ABC transporter permease subunit [Planctomycetota bacterium]
MTFILVRKFLRDVRPALIAVCLLLFAFSAFWVKITQRVTTQIVPIARLISQPFGNAKVLESVFVRGPSKVSQAALGWGDMNFDRPNEFLAIGLLHPIVLVMCLVWGVGRAAGAVAGELDRGTMELLMSQPVPRNRLILAHLLTDCVVLPVVCLSFFAGTQFGLWAVGDFVPDYALLDDAAKESPLVKGLLQRIPRDPTPLEVSGRGELVGLVNTLALVFAISGMTLALSSVGRSRWKVIGYAVLIVVVMFVANTIGQLWDAAEFVRPLTFFYYYQPQRAMIDGDWTVDLSKTWHLGRPVPVPAVGVLFAVGAAGYAFALWAFARRDLPAPL